MSIICERSKNCYVIVPPIAYRMALSRPVGSYGCLDSQPFLCVGRVCRARLFPGSLPHSKGFLPTESSRRCLKAHSVTKAFRIGPALDRMGNALADWDRAIRAVEDHVASAVTNTSTQEAGDLRMTLAGMYSSEVVFRMRYGNSMLSAASGRAVPRSWCFGDSFSPPTRNRPKPTRRSGLPGRSSRTIRYRLLRRSSLGDDAYLEDIERARESWRKRTGE